MIKKKNKKTYFIIGRTTIRSPNKYKIPTSLKPYVQLVHGISDFSPLC